MIKDFFDVFVFFGLIETWDVLKFDNSYTAREFIKINRNMRCIEIGVYKIGDTKIAWLIETWDVLKLAWLILPDLRSKGLIETWDVLKSTYEAALVFYMGD